MSLAEVEKEALALPDDERAGLVVSLIKTLLPLDAGISDAEV